MDSDILNPSGINNETAVKGTPKIISSVSEFLVSNKSLESSDMVFGLQDLLGDRYIDYISQHNTPCDIVVFGDDDGKYVVKLERNENPITTQKEVEWYQYIKDHGVVPAHFPKYYGGYQDEGLAFYFLEYLDEYRSVGSLFLDDKLSNEELVKASTDAITTIEEMFHALPRKKDPEVAKKVFADRLQSRIAEMYKYPYLKEMLEREEIVINGKAYKNIPYYMEKLVNHPLLSEIAEKEVGIIHGDMHFGNILLGGDDRPFMFLDPNGALYLPLEYDYSKILYATHTGYDFLHMG